MRFFYLLCLSFLSLSSFAGIILDEKYRNNQNIQNYIENIWHSLPEHAKEILEKRDIFFTFHDFKQNYKKVPVNQCGNFYDLKNGQDVFQGGKTYLKLGLRKKASKVLINRLYIDVIKGKYNKKFPCAHKNLKKKALAAGIHELMHIYEYLMPEEEKKFQSKFRDLTFYNEIGPFSLFKYRHGMNTNFSRSPDPYEYKNAQESFAVNMEYFLLDPEYACRLPTRYKLLSRWFKFKPFSPLKCKVNRTLVLDTLDFFKPELDTYNLDPKKLYQVHYLLAKKGNTTESSYGHAMIRLVMCDPRRDKVGPDCLKDTSHHLVISFVAYMNNLMTNMFKAIGGGYEAGGMILPFESVVDDYSIGQDRKILSIPLDLFHTEEEKEFFIDRVLEVHSTYKSHYYVFLNNCVHETRNFLKQSILDENDPNFKKVYSLLPNSLLKSLYKNEIIDENSWLEKTSDEAVENDLYIYENSAIIEQGFWKTLKGFFPKEIKKLKFYKFIKKYSPEQRQALYQDILKHTNEMTLEKIRNEEDRELGKSSLNVFAEHVLFLEREAYRKLNLFFLNEAKKIIFISEIRNDKKLDKETISLRDNFKKIMDLRSGFFSRDMSAYTGYGIPLESDSLSEGGVHNDGDKAKDLKASIDNAMKASRNLLPSYFENAEKINENIRYWYALTQDEERF